MAQAACSACLQAGLLVFIAVYVWFGQCQAAQQQSKVEHAFLIDLMVAITTLSLGLQVVQHYFVAAGAGFGALMQSMPAV